MFKNFLKRFRDTRNELKQIKFFDEKIVEVFELNGNKYYMFADPLNTLTGRGLASLVYYEELISCTSNEYLKYHVEEVKKAMTGGRPNLTRIAQLNANLDERLHFSVKQPELIYKFASVVFFTKDESISDYDFTYNQKKIEEFKSAPNGLAFFLQTPLRDLIPFFELSIDDTHPYSILEKKLDQMHMRYLREAVSKEI